MALCVRRDGAVGSPSAAVHACTHRVPHSRVVMTWSLQLPGPSHQCGLDVEPPAASTLPMRLLPARSSYTAPPSITAHGSGGGYGARCLASNRHRRSIAPMYTASYVHCSVVHCNLAAARWPRTAHTSGRNVSSSWSTPLHLVLPAYVLAIDSPLLHSCPASCMLPIPLQVRPRMCT